MSHTWVEAATIVLTTAGGTPTWELFSTAGTPSSPVVNAATLLAWSSSNGGVGSSVGSVYATTTSWSPRMTGERPLSVHVSPDPDRARPPMVTLSSPAVISTLSRKSASDPLVRMFLSLKVSAISVPSLFTTALTSTGGMESIDSFLTAGARPSPVVKSATSWPSVPSNGGSVSSAELGSV